MVGNGHFGMVDLGGCLDTIWTHVAKSRIGKGQVTLLPMAGFRLRESSPAAGKVRYLDLYPAANVPKRWVYRAFTL